MYGYKCDICGAYLDPGEKCEDCQRAERRRIEKARKIRNVLNVPEHGQIEIKLEGLR
jgi:hypothetical protein